MEHGPSPGSRTRRERRDLTRQVAINNRLVHGLHDVPEDVGDRLAMSFLRSRIDRVEGDMSWGLLALGGLGASL